MKAFVLLVAFSFQLSAISFADAAIYIVRHAEKKDPKADASLLSSKGKKRAKTLKKVLASAELKAVYCTEYERTQQTAAPVAEAQKLKPVILSTEEPEALLTALRALPASDDALVVGHSDTIPDLLKALGVVRPVVIAPDDFDNLWVVTPTTAAAPGFAWLHY